jgi:23S rRNA (uracil1939-C5)-methyltransferase
MKLKIENISNMGFGIALSDNKDQKNNKIFIPKTAIGDEIEAEITKKTNKFTLAKLTKILKESSLRRKAECEYFDKCGGCSLQHLKEKAYLDFKKQNIAQTILRSELGFDKDVEFIEIGKNSRRRVSFHVSDDNKLGFFQENSHDLVQINHCLMLEKDLSALIEPLQNILTELPNNFTNLITISKFDNILDVLFELKQTELPSHISEKLALFAKDQNNINLSVKIAKTITSVFQKSKPSLGFGNIKIDVPNNIFLQATIKGQEAIVSQILQFIDKNKPNNVVDIFCGIGTYSFAILDKVENVKGFEGSNRMVSTIKSYIKKNKMGHKISAYTRNLSSNPLGQKELKNFDLAIVNPPRTGAKAQALKLAKSEVSSVIMVSCDLNTFANDSKILIDGGFKIEKLVAIDQFYYTSHIELVAIFRR